MLNLIWVAQRGGKQVITPTFRHICGVPNGFFQVPVFQSNLSEKSFLTQESKMVLA